MEIIKSNIQAIRQLSIIATGAQETALKAILTSTMGGNKAEYMKAVGDEKTHLRTSPQRKIWKTKDYPYICIGTNLDNFIIGGIFIIKQLLCEHHVK